jgi:hypothetical protein
MAVQCEGDCWIMEQLGEKHDFEAQLSRLGFRHEDFALDVRRADLGPHANQALASHYAVRVSNVAIGKRNIYWGGPGEDWVAQFVVDAGKGFFGEPMLKFTRTAPTASMRNARRPIA